MSSDLAPLTPMGCLRWHVVAALLRGLRPDTVLEVGCGQGAVGTRLTRMARDYTAVEPDPTSQRLAAERITPLGGSVIRGDDLAVPAGTTYDLVCAFEVLEHIADDAGALARWTSLVRPGGHLLLSVPAWPARFGPMDSLVGHYRRYTPEVLAARMSEAGLTGSRLVLYGWPFGHLLEYGRNRIARRRMAAGQPVTAEEGTASSGRLLQPGTLVGMAVRLMTVPFRYVQRLAPARGTGLVAIATRPDTGRPRSTAERPRATDEETER